MPFSFYNLAINIMNKKQNRLPRDFTSSACQKIHAEASANSLKALEHDQTISIKQGWLYKKQQIINSKPFDRNRETVIILADINNRPSGHLAHLVSLLSGRHNVVLFATGNADMCIQYGSLCNQVVFSADFDHSLFGSFMLVKQIRDYPNVSFVLMDKANRGFLMHELNRADIATVLQIDKALLIEARNLRRVLKNVTCTVYPTHDLAEETRFHYISAYPDQGSLLYASKDNTDIDFYARQLITAGKNAARQIRQEQRDAEYLCSNTGFDYAYWAGDVKGKLTQKKARKYIRNWKSGVIPRRPRYGFHPGIYAAHHDTGAERIDPFVHYLKAGQPKGPWNWDVICETSEISAPALAKKVALHIHAYYPQMLDNMMKRLLANEIRPDLFISVNTQSAKTYVEKRLRAYPRKVDIRIVPNRGRDIGPFLTEFGSELVEGYDIIGHIHSKQSPYIKKRYVVAKWNAFLMNNLLGDGKSLAAADTIIQKMSEDSNIGLVFPDDRSAVSWTKNRKAAQEFALRLGMQTLPDFFTFPVGTMFWATPAVLQPFINLQLGWDDYPEEPLPIDGTVLHAIERLFGIIPQTCDKTIVCTYLGDIRRR